MFIYLFIITRDSEVIMFSLGGFVCLCVCHDVCPDDLTMKDCRQTNNISQVYSWGHVVVQVVCDVVVTSLMTSPGRKVGQILKSLLLSQFWAAAK